MATILVVDDNHMVLAEICEALEHIGHRVLGARHGEEALEVVQDNEVDVVIMDILMPGLGGIEATQLLRGYRPGLPIIVMSNGEWAPSAKRFDAARRAGATMILAKPFDQEGLQEVVNNCLARGR